MIDHEKREKNVPQTTSSEGDCDFSQKQARNEMKKEDERKIVSKMMKNI